MGFIKPNNNSGGSGGGLTPQELSRLNNAYTHSKSEHAPTTAEQNVQPDWNETDTTSDAYIKNKPDLSQIGSGGGIPSVTQIEPQELDMPKVFFYGNALPTTKDNVNLTMDYISNTTKFSSFVKLKCQGTSSMSYAKKNFTVAMYSDKARSTKLKKDFKGWGAQSKFCLKANYVDTTHTRNLSGARIAYDMVASRPDSEFKQQLLQCPRNGVVDGFPIKLYFNGEFYGIYTWNIPKDGWMFNMDKNNPNHMVLCAEQNNNGSTVNDNVLRCEFRKEWDGINGLSWSIEFGTLSDTLKNSFNRCVNFVMTATDQEFHDNIGDYFDLYSLLDYYCFSFLVAHIDGLGKNILMMTYDGVIWGASLYDMDSTYGANWNGTLSKPSGLQCPEQYQETNSLLWQRIEACFSSELYARYLELRQGALSLSNIIKHVEEIYDVIPDRVLADEKAKWTSLPAIEANTMTRFRNYMRDRAVYVDAQMKEIGTKVPCTGIVLSADTLSFTTTDTQTLSVVVSPDNCTDTVTWSVSPSGIATVNNGVITPISNGECTITVTCGSYSDTCNVTVALPVVECTGITLNENTLTLGGNGSDTSNLGINLLDGVEWIKGGLSIDNGAINTSSIDKYTQINVSSPGKYTLSSAMSYTYKKILLYDTDGSFVCGVGNQGNTNNVSIITSKPCIVKIGVYPNNLTWDASAVSFIGEKLDENTNVLSGVNNTKSGNGTMIFDAIILDAGTYKITNIDEGTFTYLGYTINGVKKEPNGNSTNSVIFTLEESANVIISAFPNNIETNTADKLALYKQGTSGATSIATLIATVTPDNCTQPVVWSVSPEGIVTVDNGLVTAVSNGEATVTATCGSYSDTCAVTVSGMSVNEPIQSGLTHYFNFTTQPNDGTVTEVEDLTGSGAKFVLNNFEFDSNNGFIDNALVLSGDDEYALCNTFTIDPSNDFTLELIDSYDSVRNSNADARILSFGEWKVNKYCFGFGYYCLLWRNSAYSTSNELLLRFPGYDENGVLFTGGEFKHRIYTWDSSNKTMYLSVKCMINGVKKDVNVASATVTTDLASINNVFLGLKSDSNDFTAGKVKMIRVYNRKLTDKEILHNMEVGVGSSGENTNYLANASWQDGTINVNNTGMSTSTDDRYTSVQIPAGKYALRSSNATWKKFRLSDSKGNVLYYYAGENNTYDIIIDTTISDDAIFTLETSYYKPNDTIEVPSLVTTDRTNITTVTLDGSLNYSIPVWDNNPSGQNGQVNVEYMLSGLTTVPMFYKLEGYTYNNELNNAESIGLAKQYNLGMWNESLYLRFTLDMTETGVINDVGSITNYLNSNPLTFKYVR